MKIALEIIFVVVGLRMLVDGASFYRCSITARHTGYLIMMAGTMFVAGAVVLAGK